MSLREPSERLAFAAKAMTHRDQRSTHVMHALAGPRPSCLLHNAAMRKPLKAIVALQCNIPSHRLQHVRSGGSGGAESVVLRSLHT